MFDIDEEGGEIFRCNNKEFGLGYILMTRWTEFVMLLQLEVDISFHSKYEFSRAMWEFHRRSNRISREVYPYSRLRAFFNCFIISMTSTNSSVWLVKTSFIGTL